MLRNATFSIIGPLNDLETNFPVDSVSDTTQSTCALRIV